MICLKNRTFAVSQTAFGIDLRAASPLWFAWKIVLLQYHKQLPLTLWPMQYCCDLLEKSYFCSITNSKFLHILWRMVLWFAWKIVLLQYHKQLNTTRIVLHGSCDLLEKSYFCSITNSLFNRWDTLRKLWFAWKIVLLQYHKQPTGSTGSPESGCDLLEKSYFCSITNSEF